MRAITKRILLFGVVFAALLAGAFRTPAAMVEADVTTQTITVAFGSSKETYVFQDTFSELDFLPHQTVTLTINFSDFNVKAADWVLSPTSISCFDVHTLQVVTVSDTQITFSFQLNEGVYYTPTISIWCAKLGGTPSGEAVPEGYKRGNESLSFADETIYKVNLYLPKPSHKVVFDKNCDDDVTGMPDGFTVKSSDAYRLSKPATDPSRAGDNFVGWSGYPNIYYGVFDMYGNAYADNDVTTIYAFWESSKSARRAANEESDSDSESSAPEQKTDPVVTCQMAGYPANYEWNENDKACQPGWLDEAGVFHSERLSVPNTADGY